MSAVLEVNKLCKSYPAFQLKQASFSLREGKITGFIGRNGAGKSTTLNSIMSLVHPDSGEILFWGKEFETAQQEIKQRIGFVSSGMSYYPLKRLKAISAVTASFYSHWDKSQYEKYMRKFGLDENKTPAQLSNGMKIKYALALALSHNADLLILDEPSSGLDPVSREELLEIFMQLSDSGKTILFSTHICSDLDKCADDIIYIRKGEILAQKSIDSFEDEYRLLEYSNGQLNAQQESLLSGRRRSKGGYTAIVSKENLSAFPEGFCHSAGLEDIMVHLESEDMDV